MRAISENVRKLREAIDFVEYYNSKVYGCTPRIRKMGKGSTDTLCPLHLDTDPSFHYWSETKIYKCFGCGRHGDIIQLHREIERLYKGRTLSQEEAMEELAQLYSVQLEYREDGKLKEEDALERLERQQKEIRAGLRNIYGGKTRLTLPAFLRYNKELRQNPRLSLEGKVGNYQLLDRMLAAETTKKKDV